MTLPEDYAERVYAGVLGKIIGVYLGRPFEGWEYERIVQELGEIQYYVHERLNAPLVVTDDDISGTFTFLRALADYGASRYLSAEQIGQTWLNYIIENRTVLWWGGMGNSTEHTAYLRLKRDIPAPQSGSIEMNGPVVAEQIGSQIFIDGWGMVAPGDPEMAAELARRAASVSHDGEAIYGAQIVAAMEGQAFVEADINTLLNTAVELIPHDSVLYRMIDALREWHAAERDWRENRAKLAAHYGYDKYGGNCHIIPNHGLIILALLHGNGDFQRSLMIVNTCGWDTDCNSGNVGCLLGIRNGLAGIEAGPDWRGPVADRLYLPTADGGRAVTDAVSETVAIVNLGRTLAGQTPVAPKGGARYHFDLPGAVQGFRTEESAETRGVAALRNVAGHSAQGARSLALRYRYLAPGRAARAATATFIPLEAKDLPGYGLMASPTLYSGQKVRAGMLADSANNRAVTYRLYIQTYDANDALNRIYGPEAELAPGATHELAWRVPDTEGYPIAEIGIELRSPARADGAVYLDYLTWDGAPEVALRRTDGGTMWRRAWVNGVDEFASWAEPYRLIQNEGIGLLIQGTREWTDYRVSATITPHLARSAGIAARVQGLRRYVALLLCNDDTARLVRVLDGHTVLAETAFSWDLDTAYALSLQVKGSALQGWIDGKLFFDLPDADQPLTGGAVALVCEEGRIAADTVRIQPAG